MIVWLSVPNMPASRPLIIKPAEDNLEPSSQTALVEEKKSTATASTKEAEASTSTLPSTLVTRLSDDETFWYVGKPTVDSLAEIPFQPGMKPGAPIKDAALHENPGFLGAAACRECHQNKYDSFIQTAHHLTSRPATPDSVAGPLEEGNNQLVTANPDVAFTMIQRGDRLFQQVRFYEWQFEVPFDIVFGSSKLAQTFLYWNFDSLYQMNVTYLSTVHQWINSPGYIDGDAAYARPIGTRCFECHTTYADIRALPNRFTPSSIIFGISCERCHGPGQEHVTFHRSHPHEKSSHGVTVPSKLPRDREIDVCGQCHSGASPIKTAPYAFRPGDRLDDHYDPLPPEKIANSVHVSNQAVRLKLSQCFQRSEMSCSTCHDPHRNEHGQIAVFSKRCMECHDPKTCGKEASLGDKIRENCIDCHMPNEGSENLLLESPEQKIFPPLRDHFIRVKP